VTSSSSSIQSAGLPPGGSPPSALGQRRGSFVLTLPPVDTSTVAELPPAVVKVTGMARCLSTGSIASQPPPIFAQMAKNQGGTSAYHTTFSAIGSASHPPLTPVPSLGGLFSSVVAARTPGASPSTAFSPYPGAMLPPHGSHLFRVTAQPHSAAPTSSTCSPANTPRALLISADVVTAGPRPDSSSSVFGNSPAHTPRTPAAPVGPGVTPPDPAPGSLSLASSPTPSPRSPFVPIGPAAFTAAPPLILDLRKHIIVQKKPPASAAPAPTSASASSAPSTSSPAVVGLPKYPAAPIAGTILRMGPGTFGIHTQKKRPLPPVPKPAASSHQIGFKSMS
jgi:hypothetical protein